MQETQGQNILMLEMYPCHFLHTLTTCPSLKDVIRIYKCVSHITHEVEADVKGAKCFGLKYPPNINWSISERSRRDTFLLTIFQVVRVTSVRTVALQSTRISINRLIL